VENPFLKQHENEKGKEIIQCSFSYYLLFEDGYFHSAYICFPL
jgi:hypothetical protein